ncbi:MAG: hypothetical protein II185_05420 [Firmicutes bacterium]|jgi:hypothetical protein|nr:hypothetical protein [Bacillota bacterium]MBQ6670966.1 hypothetical protein [Bacillota bacterium]
MLEVLLFQYKDMFGEDFPLAEFKDAREIDVINIVYDCVLRGEKYNGSRNAPSRIKGVKG